MIEETGFGIEEIFNMDQQLLLRFHKILVPAQELSNFCEGENRHHQSIIPEILLMLVCVGNMLHAPKLGARELIHRPLRPGIQPRQIDRIFRFLVHVRQGKEDSHGIDILACTSLRKPVSEPGFNDR